MAKPLFKKATIGDYLKNPLFQESPFRKADVEYPFYDKNSLNNRDMERFVKEATPRRVIKESNSSGIIRDTPQSSFFQDLLSDPV